MLDKIVLALLANPKIIEWANVNNIGLRPSREVADGWIAQNIVNLAKEIQLSLEAK